ncbi:hypothetical protein [Butyrivibrio sp. WCE2006]|uniref:hypothetical protein n=1 Tax=Butyrivibrio sp. WCE2006 TaxID=1410611 RepID=UPI0005D27E11|nr:hypothetical protein [Butyrivibrio sp. WCE2006]
MKRYSLYGLIIESEVEFMQLNEVSSTQKNSREVQVDAVVRQCECEDEVIKYLTEHDSLKRKYEIGLDYACFFNMGGYYVIKNGREIIFQTANDYTPERVAVWLLGYCMAILLLQRRILAIHCSAVTDGENGAFLISGEMGAGKSSLTRKLIEKGFKMMADDVAAVKLEAVQECKQDDNKLADRGNNITKEAIVYSAFPYQKLCRNEVESRNLNLDELLYIDETKDKFLVPAKNVFIDTPQKLKFMVYLVAADSKELSVHKLTGFDQLMAVKNNLFLHRLCGAWENEKDVLELCIGIAGNCPVYLIVRPREGFYQDRIAEKVIDIFNGKLEIRDLT